MSNEINAQPVLSRQSFTLGSVQFLDANGTPYTPTKVEKRVSVGDGTVITDWLELGGTSGFENGDAIEITADEAELQDANALYEQHVVEIVADRETDTENPLVIIFQVKNRVRRP